MVSASSHYNPNALAIQPSKTVATFNKVKELQRQGVDVIGLSVGEPDFPTPKPVCDAAYEAMLSGCTKYTDNAGMFELREAICRKLKTENNITYTPAQILCTNGAKQACQEAIFTLCRPGDEVICPTPSWVSYPDMAVLAGATPVLVPAKFENKYLMTADELRSVIGPKSRMLVLCSPGNPTGSMYSEDQLKALVEVLAEYPDVMVMSDEIYEQISFGSVKHVSFAAIPGMYNRTITINGFSKGYAMTGWRLGYLAAPEPIVQMINKVHTQTTGCCSAISQKAGIAALQMGLGPITPMVDEYRKRGEYVMSCLQKIHGVDVFAPDGAFYIFPRVSSLYGKRATANGKDYVINTSEDMCVYLLEAYRVALVPGSGFGCEEAIRISFATSMDVLERAMQAITAGLTALH